MHALLSALLFAPLAALLLTLPALAMAQDNGVWRCGADGRSYSDMPCAQGQAIAGLQARPAADIQAAQAAAARDQQLADALVRERLQREASVRGNGLGGFPAQAAAVKPAVAAKTQAQAPHRRKTHRPAEPEIWRAVAPASRRAKG